TFRAKAREMGYPSLATAALIGWEWLPRVQDIFATFDVTHYRPKDHPHAVRIIHGKTNQEAWIPLHDAAGVPLYPELQAELDEIKRTKIAGLMLTRDWGQRGPWPTYGEDGEPDLDLMRRTVRKIIDAAGLRGELSFTSFRHGGFTESGDAELSDAQIRATSR